MANESAMDGVLAAVTVAGLPSSLAAFPYLLANLKRLSRRHYVILSTRSLCARLQREAAAEKAKVSGSAKRANSSTAAVAHACPLLGRSRRGRRTRRRQRQV